MSTLLILSAAPYSGPGAQAGIDTALSYAAMERPVQVLFVGDGVQQLDANQDGAPVEQKSIGSQIGSFPLYGIETVFAASAQPPSQLVEGPAINTLDSSAMRSLIANANEVLHFG